MSQTNLVKITKAFIHIEKPLHLGEEVTLIVQGTVVKESKQEDEFSGEEKNIAEVRGTIAEVRNVGGKVISEEET